MEYISDSRGTKWPMLPGVKVVRLPSRYVKPLDDRYLLRNHFGPSFIHGLQYRSK